MNLADALANHARRRPDHPAIVGPGGAVDYATFHALVGRTAAHLAGLGVHPRDVVGVCLRDTAEHLTVLYALARLGAAAFPMDWRWTPAEQERLARFFHPRLVLVEPDAAALAAAPTLAVDPAWHAAVAAAPADVPRPPDDDPPLVLALSSGTTGTPKGPLLRHSHMFGRFLIYFVSLGFNETDRFLCATPLYFGGTRGYAMCSLYAGATVVLFPLPYPMEALVAAAAHQRATRLFLVPTLLRRLLALPPEDHPLLDGLALLFSTGAALHPDERDAVLARLCPRYVNFYGSTDGGGATALWPTDTGPAARSVGRPVFGAAVEVVDDAHAPVPPGQVGRIRYRNAGTVTGYHNDPEGSAQAFRDGWYYPGDLGWLEPRGYLHLAGREKDVIIRGGVNVYPAEVESVLLGHPAVADAAVVGWPSREYGEEVAAFVVIRAPVTERELVEHCRTALAVYKVPRGVFTVDELPRSGVGKVLKAELVRRLPRRDDG
jgi:acyl-CoA synthetase (AMP-forming)/AMP-acid ligase II